MQSLIEEIVPTCAEWETSCLYSSDEHVYIMLAIACLVFLLICRVEELSANFINDRFKRLAAMPVVHSEYSVSANLSGITVVGRIDEVRRSQRGVLVIGDIKTRPDWTVHQDDIIALSIYRYLLCQVNQRSWISKYGYVRFVNSENGKQGFSIVELYDNAWVEQLSRRYSDVAYDRRPCTQNADINTCRVGRCDYVSACYNIPNRRNNRGEMMEPLLCDDGYSTSAPGWSIGGLGGL